MLKAVVGYYDYVVVRKKGNMVEYAIYHYNEDGSLDDLEELVILNKSESIKEHILNKYNK